MIWCCQMITPFSPCPTTNNLWPKTRGWFLDMGGSWTWGGGGSAREGWKRRAPSTLEPQVFLQSSKIKISFSPIYTKGMSETPWQHFPFLVLRHVTKAPCVPPPLYVQPPCTCVADQGYSPCLTNTKRGLRPGGGCSLGMARS